MEFKLGKFKTTDIIIMSTLLSKIGLGKITDIFGKENIVKLLDGKKKKDEDAAAYVGLGIALQLAEVILGNLEKCQDELYTLLSHISDLSVDEVKNLDAEVFFELVVEVINLEQFKDFIKVASRLRNTAN